MSFIAYFNLTGDVTCFIVQMYPQEYPLNTPVKLDQGYLQDCSQHLKNLL